MASQPFPFFLFILFILAKYFLTLWLLLSSILHFKPPQPEYYQVGVANSTKTKFKVETYLERVREKTSGGEMMITKMLFLSHFKCCLWGKSVGASLEVPGLPCFGLQVFLDLPVRLINTRAGFILTTWFSASQGKQDQRELELGERMSNEAVDINAEEYKKVNASSLIRS